MEDFGKRLKELRAEKNLSQEAFAQHIGVHVTHLSRYERGKSVPSLEVAQKMATAFGISLDELVYGKQNEKARNQINDSELLNYFIKTQNLDDDLKQSVIDFLDAFILKQGLRKQLA